LNIISNDYSNKVALFDPEGVNRIGAFRDPYGSQRSVQWSTRDIPLQDFLDLADKGAIWELRSEGGEIIAAFDFSVAFVLDSTVRPTIPCINPTYVVKQDNPYEVERIDFNWFHYSPVGQSMQSFTDTQLLSALMGQRSLFMDLQNGPISATYMLRNRSGETTYGMQGDIFSITNFDEPLAVSDLPYLKLGYSFAFYECRTPWVMVSE